jgi:hypothetical protein
VNRMHKNKLVFSGKSGNLAETLANNGFQAARPLAILPVKQPDGLKCKSKWSEMINRGKRLTRGAVLNLIDCSYQSFSRVLLCLLE